MLSEVPVEKRPDVVAGLRLPQLYVSAVAHAVALNGRHRQQPKRIAAASTFDRANSEINARR
jgi:hypothetical protein